MGGQNVLISITGESAGLVGATGAAEGALSSLGGVAGRVGGLLEGAFKLAATAVAAGGAAVAAGLGVAVKGAADFEKQISAIAAVSGGATGELQALALQLGKDTSFSAVQAAQGMEALVKAGVSVKDVMGGGARAALDLAAAGAIDVGSAAEIASNAMNVFHKSGADMAHIADQIAGAANASAIDVNDYKFSLAAAGAVAATVGISFEDLTTGIAAMGNAGIKGSDAGTSLKTMLLNLQPSTKAQVAAFKDLGIVTADGANKFFDASGKAKSLADIAGVLQTATKGMTQQQKLATLEVMFGTDAIRAAAVMADQGADGFKELATQIGAVSAQDVANKRLDNLSGSLEKLRGSLETVSISAGMKFTPVLKRAVDAMTDLVNRAEPAITAFAGRAADALDHLIGAAPALIAMFPRVVGVVGQAFTNLGQIVGGFLGLDLDDYAAGWDTWSGIVRRSTDLVGQAFINLGQTVGRFLGLELDDYAAGWDTWGGIVRRSIDLVGVGVGSLLSAVGPLAPIAVMIGKAWVDNVVTTFRFLVDRVLPPVVSIVQQTGATFMAMLPSIQQVGGVLRGILGDTLEWLAQTVWPPFMNVVTQTMGFFTTVVLPTLPGIAATLRSALGDTVQWIAKDVWPALLSAATVAWNFISGTIVQALPGVAALIRDGLGKAIQWIGVVGWPTFLSAAQTAWNWISTTGVQSAQAIWEWVGPKLSAALRWMVDTGWPTLQKAGEGVMTWITGPASTALGGLWDWLGPKLGTVIDWLTKVGWPTLVLAGGAVLDWITGPATKALGGLWDWLGPKLGDVLNWLIQVGWPTLVMAGDAVYTWIMEKAVPALGQIWDWLGPKLGDVVTWLYKEGWPSLVLAGDAVWQMLEKFWGWAKNVWDQLEKQKVWDDLAVLWDKLWGLGTHLINDILGGPNGLGGQFEFTHQGAEKFATDIKGIVQMASSFIDFLDKTAYWLNKINEFSQSWHGKSLFERIFGRKFGEGAGEGTLVGPGGKWIDTNPTGAGTPAPSAAGGGSNYAAGSWEQKAYSAAVSAGHPNPTQFVEQMRLESAGFDPNVISGARTSSAGALGIAQMMPGTAAAWGVNPLDPEAALRVAAQKMTGYIQQYGPDLGLAAYNAGTGNVDKYGTGVFDADFANGQTRDYRDIINRRTQEAMASSRAGMSATSPLYVLPISGMGTAQPHHLDPNALGGTDIFAPAGTPIHSISGGTVTDASYSPTGGWSVMVQGVDGKQYYYAHMQDAPPVKAGQAVAAGDVIGAVGETGNAAGTGAHLHLGIGDSIQIGVGSQGGTGTNFDAVGFLNAIGAGTYAQPIEALRGNVQNLGATVATTNGQLANTAPVLSATSAKAAELSTRFSPIDKALQDVGGSFEQMADGSIKGLERLSDGTLNVSQDVDGNLRVVFRNTAGDVIGSFNNMSSDSVAAVIAMNGGVNDEMGALAADFGSRVGTLSDSTMTTWQRTADTVISTTTDMGGTVTQITTDMSGNVLGKVKEMSDGSLSEITAFGTGTMEVVRDTSGQMTTTFRTASGEVVGSFDQMGTGVDGEMAATQQATVARFLAMQADSLAATGHLRDGTVSDFGAVGSAANGLQDPMNALGRTFGTAGQKAGDALIPVQNLRQTIGGQWSFPMMDDFLHDLDEMQELADNARDAIVKLDPLTGKLRTYTGASATNARAGGGPVMAGYPYIVGEERPELFVPSQSGTILPSVPYGGGLSGSDIDRLAEAIARAIPRGVNVYGYSSSEVATALRRAQIEDDHLRGAR